MPSNEGLGLDEELPQASAAEEPTQYGQQRPVARLQRRAGHLTAQHRHLVTEHDQFDRQIFVVTPEEPEQLENPDERQVEEVELGAHRYDAPGTAPI